MKIDLISDLHLDFWVKEVDTNKLKFKVQLEDFIKNIIFPAGDFTTGDILIIAGDLGHYNNQIKSLLVELKKYYENIIVTYGNHDMYLISKSQQEKYEYKSLNRIKELKEICEYLDIYFLDGKTIEIDGIKFGGTSSWYSLPTSGDIETWKRVMNDSTKIYDGKGSYSYGMYGAPVSTPNWKTQEFWLEEKAKLIEVAKEKVDVFITHVALNEPTEDEGMYVDFVGDPNNIFYYTENIELLKSSGCKIHIHGHTHQELDYVKEGIRIICNPLGYPSEQTYTIIKQIEI